MIITILHNAYIGGYTAPCYLVTCDTFNQETDQTASNFSIKQPPHPIMFKYNNLYEHHIIGMELYIFMLKKY